MQKTIALFSNNPFYGLGLQNLVPDYEWHHIASKDLNRNNLKEFLTPLDLVIVKSDFVSAQETIAFVKSLIENQAQVIYLAEDRDKLIAQLRSIGCQGIINQEQAEQQLLIAVKAIESCGTYYSQDLSSDSYMFLLGPLIELFEDLDSTTEKLTPKEREIFQLYVTGESLVSIMKKLRIAKTTLNTHMESIRSKFGVAANREIITKYQIFQLLPQGVPHLPPVPFRG